MFTNHRIYRTRTPRFELRKAFRFNWPLIAALLLNAVFWGGVWAMWYLAQVSKS
ncbi:MAG: hypothetical protein JO253_03110 [Alphaproteobacteria bacterium]|nr:hypothetical protein [Alphaproteobacteria bacterium]